MTRIAKLVKDDRAANFMTIVVCLTVLLLSGIVIWRAYFRSTSYYCYSLRRAAACAPRLY